MSAVELASEKVIALPEGKAKVLLDWRAGLDRPSKPASAPGIMAGWGERERVSQRDRALVLPLRRWGVELVSRRQFICIFPNRFERSQVVPVEDVFVGPHDEYERRLRDL